MTSTYIWRKPFLNFTYRFYSRGKLIGKMIENHWKRSAVTEWNEARYKFQTVGVFNQETRVTDTETGEELAHITYNTFSSKATISLKQEDYQWKNLNWNHSKWQLSGNKGARIIYHGSSFQGDIESQTENPLLILAGFFVASYFWQNLVAIFMVLFIIFFVAN